MNIPETIRIGADDWRIVRRTLKKKYGETDFYERTITLANHLKSPQLEQTFGHELVHAIAMQMGWKGLDRSERKTEALGAMFVQVMSQLR